MGERWFELVTGYTKRRKKKTGGDDHKVALGAADEGLKPGIRHV